MGLRRVGPLRVGAQNARVCTFEGPSLEKHHQNSKKGPTREGTKNENCGGRGKKSENLGVQRRGGPVEGLGFRAKIFGDKDRNRTERK